MLENWIYDKEILLKISKHYKTGKPLNDTMIDNIVNSKNGLNAIYTLHSIFQGTYDLLLYSAFDKKLLEQPTTLNSHGKKELDLNFMRKHIVHKGNNSVDTQKLWHDLSRKIDLTETIETGNPAATFGHIISGYES